MVLMLAVGRRRRPLLWFLLLRMRCGAFDVACAELVVVAVVVVLWCWALWPVACCAGCPSYTKVAGDSQRMMERMMELGRHALARLR